MTPPETGRGRHPQMPARLYPAGRHARLRALHVMNHPLAILQKRRSFEGERQAARGADEQFHTEPLFQRVQPPAHHGGRDAFG